MTASRTTPVTAALDEDGLVGERLDLQLRRQRLRDARQHGADAVDDVDGGGVAGLQDADQHAALPVLAHDIGLRREAVADGGDIAQIDRGIAD